MKIRADDLASGHRFVGSDGKTHSIQIIKRRRTGITVRCSDGHRQSFRLAEAVLLDRSADGAGGWA